MFPINSGEKDMTVNNKVTAVYVGEHYIAAIKAYRSVFGADLVEAKAAVDNKRGIVMTAPVLVVLRDEYRAYSQASIFDWVTNGSTKPADPMGIADK